MFRYVVIPKIIQREVIRREYELSYGSFGMFIDVHNGVSEVVLDPKPVVFSVDM